MTCLDKYYSLNKQIHLLRCLSEYKTTEITTGFPILVNNRKKQMLFSFKEFEDTKNHIIKQFSNQPQVELIRDDHQTIYQYQKLLNEIKHHKKKDYARYTHQKKLIKNLGREYSVPKSASTRRFPSENKSTFIQTLNFEKLAKLKEQESKPNSLNRLSSQDRESNFYLTTIQNADQRASLKVIDLKENNYVQRFSKVQEQVSEQFQSEQAKGLLNLRISIIELQNQQKYLNTEISQLEQSIRYFRCLNNEIQHKINQKQKKYLVELNLALKKQSDLNSVNSRNKYFQEKFDSTQNFFIKSLKSIQSNRKSETRKCQEMIDDATQKILTFKHLKKKIEQQKLQIVKLDQKNKYKSKRISQNKNMHEYALILLKIHRVTNFIRQNSYGKINQLSSLNHVIAQEEFSSIFNGSQLGSSLANSEINFLQMTKEILKVYFKLLSDEQRLEQNYEYKVNQVESNRKIHLQNADPGQKRGVLQINKNGDIKPFNVSLEQKKQRSNNEMIQFRLKKEEVKFDKRMTEIQLKKQQKDSKKINQRILLIEEKLKFFVKKCIKFLEHVVESWLKFDQSAINFVVEMADRYILIDSKIKKAITDCLNKDILKDYFENWEKYVFFMEQLHRNPITNKFAGKDVLSHMFRRVIKTKLFNPNLPTDRIFVKLLKSIHSQKLGSIFENTQNLLRLTVDIIQYCSKFQVFIVNNVEIQQGEERSQIRRNNYSVQTSNKTESLKIDKKDPTSQASKTCRKTLGNNDQNEQICSDLDNENELKQQKQKQNPLSQTHTVVNLILAYQSEINKISKIGRNHA